MIIINSYMQLAEKDTKIWINNYGEWQLPIYNDWRTNNEHIKWNAKLHFYVYQGEKRVGYVLSGISLCNKYEQDVSNYDKTDIENVNGKNMICPICYKKYKILYNKKLNEICKNMFKW